MRAAVASSSELAARAGLDVAADGGNAVDAGLAALLVSMVTEPGICSPLGGAFLTVWDPAGAPVTIDANVAMPGRGAPPERFGRGGFDIHTDYGGGVDVTIGCGTFAVPGTIAGMELASRRFGRAPWSAVVAPAADIARRGFPMGAASTYYLRYVHLDLFGWDPASHAALHDADGVLLPTGATVHVEGLAETLDALGTEGADLLHRGELGRALVERVQAGEGLLTRADLADYAPVTRPARTTRVGAWDFATNPPPAIGGTTLTAMVDLLTRPPRPAPWDPDDYRALARVQDAVLGHRCAVLDVADDLDAATRALLDEIAARGEVPRLRSASTVHTSAVDADGLGCSFTASAGYGSGAVVAGLWLNNALGEHELNRRGYHAMAPGERMPSNMAPSVARADDGRVLAIGSPGADRITTAVLQAFLHFEAGMTLADAIAAPRLHVQHVDGRAVLGHEEDLPARLDDEFTTRAFHAHAMFFGGVAAALSVPGEGRVRLEAAADPRRTGGAAVTD